MIRKILSSIAVCLLLFSISAWGQTLSAGQILERVDQTINAAEDQYMEATLVLIDKDGDEKTRVIEMYQKGPQRRLARFTAPADQRGIAVLTLPDGLIYLYLPAYKKVKRIASHVKKNKFAGTDFSYEDMEARKYSEEFDATLLRTESEHFVLQLVPRYPDSEYSKQLMWVRKDNFVPEITEFYDQSGRLYKRLTGSRIEKIDGYWIAREQEMVDLSSDHRTRMILRDIRFDSGLSQDIFTERYLGR
jgi:outer membrane lipoprotein-sorting protein